MRSLSCIFLSLITVATVAQPKEQLIVGEWIEVRHENRVGYVVTVFGHVNEPSIRLNFKADGLQIIWYDLPSVAIVYLL